jgi:hypothetical protein
MTIETAHPLQGLIDEIEKALPEGLHGLLKKTEGAARLVPQLRRVFVPPSISEEGSKEQRAWDNIGYFYLQQRRFLEALSVYQALYDEMLANQESSATRCHKGLPLVRVSDCYAGMGFGLIARRCLMLTLIEDAIRESGSITPENTGVYFRLVWSGRLSDSELERYASQIYELSKANAASVFYPEWVLQQLDNEWQTHAPDVRESGVFVANTRYVRHLMTQLGGGSGKALEGLAE